MIIEERRQLASSAELVIDFFEHLDRHYRDWHQDHIAFNWLDADRSAFFFDERIGRWRIAMRMRLERSADGRDVVCRPKSFWLRLVVPWMTFAVAPSGSGCNYLHRIKLRLGPLSPLLQRTFLTPLRRHMADESAHLDRIDRHPIVAKPSQSETS